MELWRIVLFAVLAVVLIPTVVLMNQVSALKEKGESDALRAKQKQLTWCIRLLIAVFLIVLGVTMYRHYAMLAAM